MLSPEPVKTFAPVLLGAVFFALVVGAAVCLSMAAALT